MSTPPPRLPDAVPAPAPGAFSRVMLDGKFLRAGDERFRVRGVTYGTFAPDAAGRQFPVIPQVAADFRGMAALGANTVRVYTPPDFALLDEAARYGLRVMVGVPWSQHVAFLEHRRGAREIRRSVAAQVRALGSHPAAFLFALGNEIPAGVVRWHGRRRVEAFLRDLCDEAREAAPDALFTYVNFPPTEFLDLSAYDVCAFNVYLHREASLRDYLARLQNVAGVKPLLLAEAGADSFREGEDGQAAITAMHVRAAFEEGACGAVAFAWTDEWWRGGHPVEDWAFGLVDRERRPKPAAHAVAAAFSEAPFPTEAGRHWPRVSVVVCAYNAEDTIGECLDSLARLDYPDYEVVVVNDGSRDRTGQIAHAHGGVRVIDTPNRGLSAARNTGLGEATGEIVAYTDADVRVDREWLTFLVQPLLSSPEIVGSGGPNVVPDDDPPMAQCIARAPGGPTHVLLDDRIAEHVPGCNMAFRRDALLALGGFDPIYRRAGDDVDVAWRLQAGGGQIGFAPAALVWHRHRATVGAYWRQQVGYGEGEAWLMTHHPEKYLDGNALWRGRIYSPLPAERSLWGSRLNTGVWGTAAFPSVYRTDASPLATLPHSPGWGATALLLLVVGTALIASGAGGWTGVLLALLGVLGVGTTLARNVVHAWRSDLGPLADHPLRARATLVWLHFVQPAARLRGRIRGRLSPPELRPSADGQPVAEGPRPALADAWRSLLLLSGAAPEQRFWGERGPAPEPFLAGLAEWLRRSRALRTVVIDEGWTDDRDVSLPVGRWAWLDVRTLVEDHGGGRGMLRVGTHLRPTTLGTVAALGIGVVLASAIALGTVLRVPLIGVVAASATVLVGVRAGWRMARTAALLRRGLDVTTRSLHLTPLAGVSVRPLLASPRSAAYGLRTAAVFVMMLVWVWAGTLLLRDAAVSEASWGGWGPGRELGPVLAAWLDTPGGIALGGEGDIYYADPQQSVVHRIEASSLASRPFAGAVLLGAGFAGDGGPADLARLDTPGGLALTREGDLLVADTRNHRIRRVDRETGVITTIAGTGEPGFSGDGGPAVLASFDTPVAVAVHPNGDIFVADKINNRVRVIEHATGIVRTFAGNGLVVESGGSVGDGGSARAASLYMPSDVAVAPDGDVYVADMHHNRVRRVDARTGRIETVAGDGTFGNAPDGVRATEGGLAGPAGLALMTDPGGALSLFVADYYNGVVRAIGPDGVMRRIDAVGGQTFEAPARVAVSPGRDWLYVLDSGTGRIVALAVPAREDSGAGVAFGGGRGP